MSLLRSTALLGVAACLFAPLAARGLRGEARPSVAAAKPVLAKGSQMTPMQAAPQASAAIDADAQGHYRAEARIEGFSVPVLVDTGATLVSLSEADARRLGLFLKEDDFKYRSQTANGVTRIAVTTLHEVQLGGIRVQNVKAAIHRGQELQTTLLGMSFLGRLSGMEVANGHLRLSQ